MKRTLVTRIRHRDFLKGCGLAVLGAGAAQVAVPARPALAQEIFEDLTVHGMVCSVFSLPQGDYSRTTFLGDVDSATTGQNRAGFVAYGQIDPSSSNNAYQQVPAFVQGPVSGSIFQTGGFDLYPSNHWDSAKRYLFIHSTSVPIAFASGWGGTSSRNAEPTASHADMVITSGGNVGIGTTNPSVKLEVVGGIRASGVLDINGNVAINSSGIATQAFYAS